MNSFLQTTKKKMNLKRSRVNFLSCFLNTESICFMFWVILIFLWNHKGLNNKIKLYKNDENKNLNRLQNVKLKINDNPYYCKFQFNNAECACITTYSTSTAISK